MRNLLAQSEIPLGQPLQGLGPLGNPGGDAPSLLNRFFSGVVGIMTAIAAIWFIILIIMGAVGIMTAAGNKDALETAKNRISTGFIGIVVVLAAIFLIDIVGRLLGIEFILDPGGFVNSFSF